MAEKDYTNLPQGLPVPEDDHACDHLRGQFVPSIALAATTGGVIDLARAGRPFVLYCYPMTGRPGQPLPDGWDAIPGARGCTPETCAFRDHQAEIEAFGHDVYGLSAQSPADQKEMVERLHVPFPVLSDHALAFARALRLPTFEAGGMRLIRRLTLIAGNGLIVKVFYPVFPPQDNPRQVLDWLAASA